MFVGRISDNN